MSGDGATAAAVVERLRREEYTGPNRCWPCTALNLALLAVGAAVLSVFLTPVGGSLALVAGVLAIWLRGYLVPYTPRLTPHLLARLPIEWHPPSRTSGTLDAGGTRADSADSDVARSAAGTDGTQYDGGTDGAQPDDGTDGAQSDDETDAETTGDGTDQARSDGVEDGDSRAETGETRDADGGSAHGIVEELLAAGVLRAVDRELALEPAFREAWRTEMSEVRGYADETLATALEREIDWVADASVVTEDGRAWVVLSDEAGSLENETWLARPVAVTDLATIRTFLSKTDLDAGGRVRGATPLRQFLERCPVCETELEVTSPSSCCGPPRSVLDGVETVLACPGCDEVLAVVETTDEAAEPRPD
jgi:hypothetical protein